MQENPNDPYKEAPNAPPMENPYHREPPITSADFTLSEDGKTLVRWNNTTRTTLDMKAHPLLSQVTTIGTWAFEDRNSLKTIVFPETLTTIMGGAFSKTGLTSVIIPETVTSIGNYAFSNCNSLTSVSIPKTVTDLGDWIFENCGNLEEVTYGPKTLKASLFNNCTSLRKVILLEGVTTIGTWAFENRKALKEIHFSSTVTTINANAFSGSGLSTITIPETITTIGASAFSNCKSLISASIPKSVISLGDWVFENCENLEEVTFGPKTLKNALFSGCTNLKNVTLLEKITTIGPWAFENRTNFTTLTIKATTPPSIGEITFKNTALTHIYVPATSVDTYKNDRKWGVFADKIQAIP